MSRTPTFTTRVLSLVVSFSTLMSYCVQGGCSDDKKSSAITMPPDTETFRKTLEEFDPAVEDLIERFDALESAVQALNAASDASYAELSDSEIHAFSLTTDELLASVVNLEDIETRLQGGSMQRDGRITQALILTTIAVGLAIYSMWKFGKKMKELSDDVSSARDERDKAAEDTANGVKGADDRYTAANQKMKNKGVEAAEEFTSQVGEQMLPDAVQTVLTVKDLAGDVKAGVNVLTASKACRTSSDSKDCKLRVGRTDSQGKITVAPGTHAVIISTPGNARIAVDEVQVTKGGQVEVKRDFIPIQEATPELVSANDKNRKPVGGSDAGKDSGYKSSDAGTKPSDSGKTGDSSTNTKSDGGKTGTVSNTTLSGAFPEGDPFNGMKISYSISGVGPSTPTDTFDFTTSRVYKGSLGSGTLRISGTASQANGYGASVNASVSVEGGKTATDSRELTTPESWNFDVSVPIPAGARSGSASINMTGDYNAGTRGLFVSFSTN